MHKHYPRYAQVIHKNSPCCSVGFILYALYFTHIRICLNTSDNLRMVFYFKTCYAECILSQITFYYNGKAVFIMSLFHTFFNDSMLSFYLFVFSAVLLLTLLLTMQQNQKLLEASVRPYLAISIEQDTSSSTSCLVIKNYGNTTGQITRFHYPASLKYVPQIDTVRTVTLAPGQAIRLPYQSCEASDTASQFILTYSSSVTGKNYTNQFELYL